MHVYDGEEASHLVYVTLNSYTLKWEYKQSLSFLES